jgi:hypothetical protein
MKSVLFIVVLVLLGTGCSSTRPLSAVPEAKQSDLVLEINSSSKPKIICETARGKNARQAGAGDGLLGVIISRTIGANEEAEGVKLVRQFCSENCQEETQTVLNAVKTRLARAGMNVSDTGSNKLTIRTTALGVREVHRGFWVPFVQVSAKLAAGEEANRWKTFASSSGTKPRALKEFSMNPDLFKQDFAEAADDVARQLVQGPIRR